MGVRVIEGSTVLHSFIVELGQEREALGGFVRIVHYVRLHYIINLPVGLFWIDV